MKSLKIIFAISSLAVLLAMFGSIGETIRPHLLRVGDTVRDETYVPTGKWVKAEGRTLPMRDAVSDVALTRDGKLAVVKTSEGVSLVDVETGKQLTYLRISGGTSLTGIALSPDEQTVACSGAGSTIELDRLAENRLAHLRTLKLPDAAVGGASYPCGLVFMDGTHLAIAASRDNSVLIFDTSADKLVQRIPVDPCPYGIRLEDPRHALVTCWARPVSTGAQTAPSSGTPVAVDTRGIGVGGSLLRINLATDEIETRQAVPRQPTETLQVGNDLYLACANGDSVLKLDPTTFAVRSSLRLGALSGTAPNSLAADVTKHRLYVAFAGSDRVAGFDLMSGRLLGVKRTAWYPTVVRTDRKGGLLVATAKGIGSRSGNTAKRNVYQVTATLSFESNPTFSDRLEPEPVESVARSGAKPVPIPARIGEPSVLKHVVYVIKENRTYDQVLGDMPEGDGDPSLVMYGEQVTPNHHALAREFALLDNYYCNGILSADGHAWATESNATSYYERTRGGWTRSYPFGDDPLATSSSGYLWDNAMSHGVSVHNFGEFDYATPKNGRAFAKIYPSFLAGEQEEFGQNIGVARLRAVSERDYPGWNLDIPDVLRADRFARHLKQMEKTGSMAALTILYLPQDHTSGGTSPTPRAQVADNDLGLGRCVDALSHSKFWSTTVVFVTEDDPQAGFDHVDGHRSFCLLASPYARRHAVVSNFYNQSSVIHTIERILGLPCMNKNDATAPVMTDCFQAKPDLTPYVAKPNQIPLDESSKATAFRVNLKRPDQVDEHKFNRRLWALSGKKAPYPFAYEGAHGKGLAKRGLRAAEVDRDNTDRDNTDRDGADDAD